MGFKLSADETTPIYDLPNTRFMNVSVKSNSNFFCFIMPAIILTSNTTLPPGISIDIPKPIMKPSLLDSKMTSLVIIKIGDNINNTNYTKYPLIINASWYVLGHTICTKPFTYLLGVPPMVTITSNNLPIHAGESINLSVSVASRRSLIYKFHKINGPTLNSDFNKSTWTWKTNLSDVGINMMEVVVEDVNDKSWNRSARATYKIGSNNPPKVKITRPYDANYFIANGTDDENDDLQYKFEVYRYNKCKPIRCREWRADKTYIPSPS